MLTRKRYDYRALIGVLIAAAPDLIALAHTAPLPEGVVWTLRIVGVLLAAQGKPLVPKV